MAAGLLAVRGWALIRAVRHHPGRGQHRSTITFDYRGTGDSDEPTATCSTRQFADDVVAVLDDLGVDRADVYGTSMGGRVAQLRGRR